MSQAKKRKIDDCPNRLFLEYLSEWKNKAEENGTKAYHTYNRAYKSLLKYPLPLKYGKEAKILEHIGDKICKMLDDKLAKDAANENMSSDEYLEQSRKVHPSWWRVVESQCTPAKIPKKKKTSNNSSKHREYIPQKNSGPYALLVTLYKDYVNENSKGFMTKSDLLLSAQPLCNSSFTVPDTNSHYTAWSSMSTLINKNLVHKHGNPSKYELTNAGAELANKLGLANDIEEQEKSPITPKPKQDILDLTKDSDDEINLKNSNKIESIDLTASDNEENIPPLLECVKIDSESSTKSGFNVRHQIKLTPGKFKIVLCVDTREIMGGGKTKRSEMKRVLERYNIPYVDRCLNLGDFLWVAQEVVDNYRQPKELVLDYIVERKCVSDLAQSIRDGRYREQKLRLKRSGLKNIIYLVEDIKQMEHQSLPEKTLRQAVQNTQIIDNVHVELTDNIDATAMYLQIITQTLSKLYRSKQLVSVDFNVEDRNDHELYSFGDFNESGSKYKNTTTKQLFTRQLMLIHGMSYAKSVTITDKYPTLSDLLSAYKNCADEKAKLSLLSNLKSGILHRNIGINVSKTVFRVFND